MAKGKMSEILQQSRKIPCKSKAQWKPARWGRGTGRRAGGRRGSAVPGGEHKPQCKSIPIEARFQVLPPQLKQQKLVFLHHFINSNWGSSASSTSPAAPLCETGQAGGEITCPVLISCNRLTPIIWERSVYPTHSAQRLSYAQSSELAKLFLGF